MPELDVSINPKGAIEGSNKVNRSLKDIGDQAGKTEKKFEGMSGKLKTLLAGVAASYALRTMISNTVESEQAFLRLETVIKSTGGVAGKTAMDLAKTASSLQDMTIYGDEATMRMQAILLTFKDIRGDTFDKATLSVMDLSTALGTDLQSSALMLGKALNDPILGLTALRRVGIQFTETQTEMIKKFIDMGDVVSAQRVMLEELDNQFGGTAKALRSTLGGALTAAKNALGDLFEMEKVGGFSDLRLEVEAFTAALQTEEVKAFAEAIGGALIGGVTGLAEGFADLNLNADKVLTTIKALAAYKLSGTLLALLGITGPVGKGIAIGATLVVLAEDSMTAKKSVEELREAIGYVKDDLAKLGDETGVMMVDTQIHMLRDTLKKLQLDLIEAEDWKRRGAGFTNIEKIMITKPGKNPSGTGKEDVPGEDELTASLIKMRDEMKYLNVDGQTFLVTLDQWKAKLEPLSEPWKKVVDLQKDILEGNKKLETFSPLDKIGQAIEYLNIDGEKFLPILDKWKEKLTPLSEEWMKISDLQKAIYDRAQNQKVTPEQTLQKITDMANSQFGSNTADQRNWEIREEFSDSKYRKFDVYDQFKHYNAQIDRDTGEGSGSFFREFDIDSKKTEDIFGLDKGLDTQGMEEKLLASLEKIASAGGTTGENVGKAIGDGITKYVEDAVGKAQTKINSLKFPGFGSITDGTKTVTTGTPPANTTAHQVAIAGRGL